MNHAYCIRLEEATTFYIRVVSEDSCPVYQLMDPYNNVVEEFDMFEDAQAYTIEAVERVEASRGVA